MHQGLSRSIISTVCLMATTVLMVTEASAQPSASLSSGSGSKRISVASSSCPDTGANAGTRQRIVDVAAREWARFEFPRFAITPLRNYEVIPPGISPRIVDTSGPGTPPRLANVGFKEDDDEVTAQIGSYWAATPSASGIFAQQNQIWAAYRLAGWAVPWSAAFVSYVMCEAGLTDKEFERNEAHKAYIQAAINAGPGYRFRAANVADTVPAIGDLVCAARGSGAAKINSIADFNANPGQGAYHCDIVVGFDTQAPARPSVLYAIGGNVLDAVTLTETPMRNGRIIPIRSSHGRNWFVVLKYIGPDGPASFRNVSASVVNQAKMVRDSRRQAPN